MKLDVISVGSASVDTFVTSSSPDLQLDLEKRQVLLPVGGKVLLDSLVTDVGGSGGNTSISFARLGLRAGFLGKLGSDADAHAVEKRLKHERVRVLKTQRKGHTGYSFILSALAHDRTILTYKGSNDSLGANDVLWSQLDAKWLYLGSLLGKSWKTQKSIAQFAAKKGMKLLFNPSLYLAEQGTKKLAPVLDACNILVLNKEEAQSLLKSKGTIPQLLKCLHKHAPLVVITEGPRGAHAYDGSKVYYARAHPVKVLDPTGAGDAFASGFLAAQMYGKNLAQSLRWGVAQAESILAKFGATNDLLTKKEMEKKCL